MVTTRRMAKQARADAAPPPPTRAGLYAAASLAAWSVASGAITVVNKTVMVDKGFAYPFALCAMGLATSGLLSGLLIALGAVPATRPLTGRVLAREVVPVAACGALAMYLGNCAVPSLSMAFLQILKAFTPAVTYAVSYLAGLEAASAGLVLSVGTIVAGTAVATVEERQGPGVFHAKGFAYFMASVASEALRVVLIQKLVAGNGAGGPDARPPMHPLEGLRNMALPSAALMVLGALVWERDGLRSHGLAVAAREAPLFALASVLGFTVNLATFLGIKYASSLTVKCVGCVKNALIVYVGVLQGERVSGLQLLGYGLSVAGFGGYSYFKTAGAAAGAKPKRKAA